MSEHSGHIPAQEQRTLQNEREKQTKLHRNGANWFYWIAGLSLANSLLIIMNGGWAFIVGLGVTQVIDAVAQVIVEDTPGATALAQVLALSLDVVLALVFVGFGWLANKGKGWAFVLGMTLYLVDGTIFVLVADWRSTAFHVFALFCLASGYKALWRLAKLPAVPVEVSAEQGFEDGSSLDEGAADEVSG